MIGRSDGNGPNGPGVSEELSFTLDTVDRHAVASMQVGGATLVFNLTQVTSRHNGGNPRRNDPCHTLAASDRPPVAIIRTERNER